MSVAQNHPTEYWSRLNDGRVQCDLCPRECKLRDGQRGLCFVRAAKDGEIVLTTYGRSSGFCIDPIEKKPLNHFLPGTPVLSFGTAGCNLACSFCQNWDLSTARDMDRIQDLAAPEAIASAAVLSGCRSVAFTYNDPVVFLEYAVDIAAACRARDVKSVAVTAGFINDKPRKPFFEAMDAANIDLKSFSNDFYRKITKGDLQPVKATLEYLARETNVWFEITTLLIPGKNDGNTELNDLTKWVAGTLGPHIPIHFSAFRPEHRMRDVERTPLETLLRAREIALKNGLRHVYTGNVHHEPSASTYCHECGTKTIGRDWHQLTHWGLTPEGECSNCGAATAGTFEQMPGDWGRKRVPLIMEKDGKVSVRPLKKKQQQNLPKENSMTQDIPSSIPPQVAGKFYPADAGALRSEVNRLLEEAMPCLPISPKAMVIPHAGYHYSGKVAATAYRAIRDWTQTQSGKSISRVVILSPPHRQAVEGIALPKRSAMMTPLGAVQIDTTNANMLAALPFACRDDNPFANEHAVEVHLPFIQVLFPKASILPILIGPCSANAVGAFIEPFIDDPRTLVIISSDLSHYLDQNTAIKTDGAAVKAIERLQPQHLSREQACGHNALRGILTLAQRKNMRASALDVRTSADTVGSPERVVGYGSFVFEDAEDAQLDQYTVDLLMHIARQSIFAGLRNPNLPTLELRNIPRWSAAHRATFVTIEINGKLRGCHGSLIAHQPMPLDVCTNAFKSAYKDPRFKPMTSEDVNKCTLSISILSTPARLRVSSRAEAIASLNPGRDGVIFRERGKDGTLNQGLYLPQVWAQLPSPGQFIESLAQKAGLPYGHWSDATELYRFTVEKIGPESIAQLQAA